MCDSVTQSQIDAVVDSKVNNGELFTAFDVSLEVQGALKSSGQFDVNSHRHRFLKDDVHRSINRYLNNEYQRSLQDVGAPSQAFVYYPSGGDPSGYVPQQRKDGTSTNPYVVNVPSNPTSTAGAAGVAVRSPSPVDGAGDGAGDGRQPDSRGTVCVPSHLLRDAGFVSGDKAEVYFGQDKNSNDCLVIAKNVPSGKTSLTSYTVDSYGNVRITKSVFETTGFVSVSYDFDGDREQVFVKPH